MVMTYSEERVVEAALCPARDFQRKRKVVLQFPHTLPPGRGPNELFMAILRRND
ncbi:hypothetical protein SRU_1834 [Salinibacter ruber DSM 13855]|uniref:Uncharacterized protein n=1 Tax=Salinibacter ruber (strain DSM 13855 / M31) TaxID=309807 RepID=Q2S1I4_SALRD|nr:hypothetical protein SRU_1834 [Salinibacter ruber DSM 13855]